MNRAAVFRRIVLDQLSVLKLVTGRLDAAGIDAGVTHFSLALGTGAAVRPLA